MDTIPTETRTFDPALLEAWKNRDYRMLTDSGASAYLKSILTFKAPRRKRDRQRFFGEAFVAAHTPMIAGWFNSYRWLIDSKWVTGRGLRKGTDEPENYRQRFYQEAIVSHIGVENLAAFHAHSKEYQEQYGSYPKAPDLYIVSSENEHLLLEVKLPGDKPDTRQEDGLKLIQKHLRVKGDGRVQVKLVTLVPA